MKAEDEPLADEPTEPEIEEISDDLILVPGATLPGAVHAPGAEPSETSLTPLETARPPEPAAPKPSRPSARSTPAKPVPGPADLRPEPRLDEASTRVVIVPRESAPRSRFPLLVALVFLACGFGAGFFAGRLWERQARAPGAPPAATPSSPVAEPDMAQPRATAQRPATPAAKRKPKVAKGASAKPRSDAASGGERAKLDVSAPPGAEVFLDGRRIGRGSIHTTVAPGRHRIEVRVGKNRVAESFDAEPGGAWTYDVTSQ